MKKLIIIVSAILMTSCIVVDNVHSPYTNLYFTDYTCYASEGIYVSPFSDYNGSSYTPLGDMAVEYYTGQANGKLISPTSLQGMLDKLVESAKVLDANGILNVKVNKISNVEWLASGTIVKFEGEMPKVEKLFDSVNIKRSNNEMVKPGEISGVENVKQLRNNNVDADKLVNETLEYCHKNNIALKKEENKEEYIYDINTHSYIKHYMYWQKYGMPAYDLLMKQYKKNKK
ncbi:MAG: hypothetical protein II231_01455 [Rikenellaceae bacterium]|nr:hypothetical protein [Rikenellaceae bacterium]